MPDPKLLLPYFERSGLAFVILFSVPLKKSVPALRFIFLRTGIGKSSQSAGEVLELHREIWLRGTVARRRT